MTAPLRSINHRLAIEAAKTNAIDPVPVPTTTPHNAMSCQGALMKIVEKAPVAITVRAIITTLRIPKRSISAAANGETKP